MAASPLLNDPFILAPVALLVVALAVFLLLRGRKPWIARLRRRQLLTANEAEFFRRLQRALPGFHVFPQVSFAAFLTDDGKLSRNAKWAVRSKFDRKIADFVICERGTLKVVAVVELDDRTHDARADRQRDAITKAAGYQTHIGGYYRPDEPTIVAFQKLGIDLRTTQQDMLLEAVRDFVAKHEAESAFQSDKAMRKS